MEAPLIGGDVTGIQFFDRQLRAAKTHTQGTHRTRSPEQTLQAYLPLASRMGITRVANITGLDSIGLPVYTAIRPNSRSLATSQGKGLTAAAAKASALMESIETWHAEHIEAPLRWDSYAALSRKEPTIDPAQLVTLRNRVAHKDTPRPWISGFDLLRRTPIWLPFECVSLYFVTEGGVNATPFLQSSTGISSGNHLLEALTHGLCEVVERDAEVLWVEARGPLRVDLASVNDPACRQVLALLERAGVFVAAWDMTSDIGVPAYACVVMDRPDPAAWRRHGAYSGFGCHLAPGIALLRALTEAVQSRVTFIAGSRDDMFRRDYASLQLDEGQRARWSELNAPVGLHEFAQRQSLATDSFEGDVHALLERLQAAGLDSALVVDLTRSDIGIPVVKVLVPGLGETGEESRRVRRAPSRRAA